MEILYKVHNNLYVNLTNKCPCACTFCLRQTMDRVGESGSLWLEREPAAAEVIRAFDAYDMERFGEVVFCGFGEPTEALPVLLDAAVHVKRTYGKPIRINTNGMGNLIWNRDITPEFEGLADTVSISLNTPNAERYHELVRSRFGDRSFDAMLDFAKKCTEHVPRVVMTTVETTITRAEEEECRRICEEIGAVYRIRPWEN
ncbi:MAG: TatD family nuclease-associated radical SAM protein [Lachnospiraceae bacterium]|nr:TatD family nuclease-associated radical SAM protein [Lachnospiraceae bacterium]